MKHSEKVLMRIAELQDLHECDMVEACVIFCQEGDIDPHDLIKSLDKTAVKQIEVDAIRNNRVRKCTAKSTLEVIDEAQ